METTAAGLFTIRAPPTPLTAFVRLLATATSPAVPTMKLPLVTYNVCPDTMETVWLLFVWPNWSVPMPEVTSTRLFGWSGAATAPASKNFTSSALVGELPPTQFAPVDQLVSTP